MTLIDEKHEGKKNLIPQPSDPLGSKLDELEKLLESAKSRDALVKANLEELSALLEEALWSDGHWRAAIGCISYLDRTQAAKLWASFDSVLTAKRSEDIFEKHVPPQTKLALGAIVRTLDPTLAARLVTLVLESWSPAKTKKESAASSVAQALEKYFFGDEQWIPVPLGAEVASWVVPKLVEALASRPAKKKLKPTFAREFALWAATELKNTELGEPQRHKILESIFPLGLSFEDAWRRETFTAAGLQEVLTQVEESAALPIESGPEEPGPAASTLPTVSEDIDVAGDASAESAAKATIEQMRIEVGPAGPPSQEDKAGAAAPELQTVRAAEPEALDLTLLSQALELADDIRSEIERRRREETTIRALASELRRTLIAHQEAEHEVKQLKKDLKAVRGQKQRAADDLKAERATSASLRETLDSFRAEVADKQKQIDDLHETLAAAQKEHDFRIDNQVPLRVQAAMDRLGARISGVFENVRSGDEGELDADHAVVLRELFRRLEKLLKEQGVPV
jgi:hypothetical protein